MDIQRKHISFRDYGWLMVNFPDNSAFVLVVLILFGYSNNLDLVILLSPHAPKKTKKSEEKSI